MQLAEDNHASRYRITGYTPDAVQVNEAVLTDSFLISPDALLSPWPVRSVTALNIGHWQTVLDLVPDPSLILLGTGQRLVWPAQAVLTPLYERQIGIEIMTTPAACRTYHLLASQGSHFVAVMIVGEG